MRALAMDLGASGGKFLLGELVDNRLRVSEVHRFANTPLSVGGHLVWNLEHIRENMNHGLAKAATDGFSSFGVDSFCNDYGLLEAKGDLLAPVYSYRDARTEGILERMESVMSARELYTRTGCQRARFNTLVQLAAQIEEDGGRLFDQAESLLFLPDYLNTLLCGQKAAEFTVSSVSQLFNRATNDWDADILRAFSIPRRLMQNIVHPATLLGEGCDVNGRHFNVCATGHHDTASAVAAVPARKTPFAYLSSGTWSLMGTETAKMITTDAAFRLNFANEGGLAGRNRFLKNIMGLWLLQEAQRQFAEKGISRDFASMDADAAEAQPFRSIINPDDTDFFEPGNMVGKIQTQCMRTGQPIPETVGEVTRCVQESLALTYRATLLQLERLTGFQFDSLHVIGGGSRSRVLNQMTASALELPIYAGPVEAAAIGNLCAQFIAAGEISGLDEARQVVARSFELEEYLPQRDTRWQEARERFELIRNLD
jgi:rhamnulokinase